MEASQQTPGTSSDSEGYTLQNLYSIKLENLKEIGDFLDLYSLSKLNQNEINNLNRSINPSEGKAVLKSLKTKENKKQHTKKQNSKARLFQCRIQPYLQQRINTITPQIIQQNRIRMSIFHFFL